MPYELPKPIDRFNYITNNNGMFNIYAYVPAGSIYEKKGIRGISHLLEHMLMKRTKNLSNKELYGKMTEIGGITNAGTVKDLTYYYINTHIDNFKTATDIMYDIIKNPEFDKEELEKEKKVVLEEYAMYEDDWADIIYNTSIKTVLNKNEYEMKIIGEPGDIKRITIKDLQNYFNKYYISKFILCVNIDKKHLDSVEKYIDNVFKLDMRKVSKLDISSLDSKASHFSVFPRGKIEIMQKDFSQYNTVITFPSFSIYMVREMVVLNFLRFALTSSGLNSLLFRKIRLERGLVYSISSSSEENRGMGLFQISFGTTNANTVYIMSLILSLLSDLKVAGLNEKDLKYFKKSMMNSQKYLFSKENFKELWEFNSIFYQLNLDQSRFMDIIQDIKNEDIKSVSSTVFDFIKMGILTVGNYTGTSIKEDIDSIRETYQKISTS